MLYTNECTQDNATIAKPPDINNVDKFIKNLLQTLKDIPKASKYFNLLTQLQKHRESDRPIAEIHSTLCVLEETLCWWQKFHAYVVSLLKKREKRRKKVKKIGTFYHLLGKIRALETPYS